MTKAIRAVAILFLLLAESRWVSAQDSKPSVPERTTNYRLSPGDVIAVKIFPQPDMDRQCRVAKDGTVDFPLVRTVAVAGKTTVEAGNHLAALLNKDYLVNPQVMIDVVSYAKQSFVVMGAVQSAGSFSFPDEGELSLISALAAAGGATRMADLSKVIIQRANTQPIVVDLRPTNRNSQPIQILPHDVIHVPERMF